LRGIKPLMARRGVAHVSGRATVRGGGARTFAGLHQFKRLRIRYERRADLHQGLLELAPGKRGWSPPPRSEPSSST
ncbi:IS5/IS1182 family transposase, partial [Streptomyces sp. NPDC059656]